MPVRRLPDPNPKRKPSILAINFDINFTANLTKIVSLNLIFLPLKPDKKYIKLAKTLQTNATHERYTRIIGPVWIRSS